MIRINLIPVEETERAAGRRHELAVGSLVLAVVVFGLVSAHLWQSLRLSGMRREIRRVTQEIAAIEGPYAESMHIEQQKQELREKLRVIGQLEAKKVGPVRILADLSSATPDKLWLTEFADSNGTLKLTGIGVDEQTVADFLRKLGTLPFFQTVDLDETSQVDQEGVKLKKFVIRGQIDYGAPAGGVATAAQDKKPNAAAAGVKR
jgi:type IV pilus assembly protein PilN